MTGNAVMSFGARKRDPRRRFGWMAIAVIAAALVLLVSLFLRGESVSVRQGEQKIVKVVLPPPPPPPPEPEVQPEPEEVPPPPTPTPMEQPQEAPTPSPNPDEAAPGDDALTAREGAGPSNYGLARGDGSGTRIGGRAGPGMGHSLYAQAVVADIRRAVQGDPRLSRGRFSVQLAVTVDPDGRVARVRVLTPTGDAQRDRELEERLVGLQLSRKPPEGLPVMRIELNARSDG